MKLIIRLKFKGIIILFSFTIWAFILNAQNVKQEIININKAYENIGGVIIEAQLLLYNSFISVKPIEEQQLTIHRQGNRYKYKLGNSEMIRNDDYFLLADYSNKIIILDSAKSQQDQFRYFTLSQLDSTMKLYKSVSLASVNSNISRIIFQPDVKSITKFEVFYNQKTYFISKIVFFLNVNSESGNSTNQARMEITYNKFQTGVSFKKAEFSVSHFVNMKRKKRCSSAFLFGFSVI